ncbi:MAG TPA: serine hydroxymethyltransferase [Dehalococcoidia bacterium]|jgi:glycine hydroxymethyltransferase|nr:serine hydroxymethyltransferase [Dehalococcoidia bacterium]
MTTHVGDPYLAEVERTDREVFDLIKAEERYQVESIRLIPSENYTSRAVMEATGSVLANKYSEGYPGRRYYEGQRYIDQLETLVQDRAKALFGVDHANVQPYSGSPANLAVYYALLQPGDTIMGLALPHGGHLTHGWGVSATGRFWRSVQYEVDPGSHHIDYDQVRAIAKKERPQIIVAGATAYPRQYDFKAFGEIAQEVGARFLADISHIAGLIVAGVHPDPAPYADAIMTTTHKTLRGPRGAMILCREEHAEAIDKAVFPGLQGGPHENTIAGVGVALKEAATPEFREYGAQVVANAKALAAELRERGFDLITGGTDNHLILIDLTGKKVIGKKAAKALDRANIVGNYNTIPFDPRKPFSPSGLRIGTPSVTTRGMKEGDMRQIARWMDDVVAHVDDAEHIDRIGEEVRDFCRQFPAPGMHVV